MSDTPRTDVVYEEMGSTPTDAWDDFETMLEHARTLERELAAAKAERCPNLKISADGIYFCESLNATLLKAENAALQAKIDRLMLEYCPEEMTAEQKQNWAAHQKPAMTGEGE